MMITLGRDLSALEKQLKQSFMMGVALGLLVVGGMSLWLWWVLRNGLKPLEKLTRELAQIDSKTLDHRFGGQEEPQELIPMLSHLDGLMERLEAGFFRERRFGSDLAHELRTPLAELRMKLELVRRWPDDLDPSFFDEMGEIHQRMEETVATLLRLAQLEGRSDFKGARVTLLPVVEKVWSQLADRAGAKSLKVELACPDDYEVEGEANLWYHIVSNLLENAVEYTPEGGIFGVRFRDHQLEFWNTAGELTADDVARMFERFWRADDSRQSARHSGLGLSLVKACAEEMGYQVGASLDNPKDESFLTLTVHKSQSAIRG